MPIFVSSTAGGANDGTSWLNAYTGFVDATNDASATGGQFIYVHTGHAGLEPVEDWTTTAPNNDPLKVISVDSGNDTYVTGATITTLGAGTITIGGGYYFAGIHFISNPTMNFGSSDARSWYDECQFDYTGAGNLNLEQSNAAVMFTNCSLQGSANIRVTSDIQFVGNRWDINGGPNIMESRVGAARIDLIANDFSQVNSAQQIIRTNYTNDGISYIDMVMNSRASGQDLEDTNDSYHVGTHNQFHHFDEYWITGQTITHGFDRYYQGTITVTTGVYREEGVFDGASNMSIAVAANSGSTHTLFQPMYTDWIYGFTTGDASTAYTYDVHIAHAGDGETTGGLYRSDQVWLEIALPNDQNSGSRASYISTRANPYTTNPVTGLEIVTIDEDTTSTWVGAGTQQRLRVTHTPAKPGPMQARVAFAPGYHLDQRTLYIDPYIVTGES